MNRNNNQQLIPLFDIIPKANPNGETPFTKDFSNSPLVHQKPSTSPSTSDLIDLSPYNVKDQQTPSQSQNLPQSLQIQIQPPPRSDQSWVVILNGNASVKYSQQIPSLYPKPSTESTSENNKSNCTSSSSSFLFFFQLILFVILFFVIILHFYSFFLISIVVCRKT
jgi:hypothetical protein